MAISIPLFARPARAQKPTPEPPPKPLPETAIEWRDDTRARELAQLTSTTLAAIGLGGLSAIFAAVIAGLVALIVFRPPSLYVLAMDPVTGAPGMLTRVDELTLTPDETRDRYWLRTFVLARESYNAYTVSAEDRTVSLLAAKSVADAYREEAFAFEDEHEGRLDDARIEVEIGSISVEGNGVATVRFTETLFEPSQPAGPEVNRYIARIAYTYRPNVTMAMRDRIENPLAFTVESYRIDEDFER